jgi:hypothetical protein
MSRVEWAEAITLLALGGLGVRWWLDYRRHRHAGARSHVQRLRAWRGFGLSLVLIGLCLELLPFHGSLIWRILLGAGSFGLGGCTVIVTWLALAANRRYPGILADVDPLGGRHQRDRGP